MLSVLCLGGAPPPPAPPNAEELTRLSCSFCGDDSQCTEGAVSKSTVPPWADGLMQMPGSLRSGSSRAPAFAGTSQPEPRSPFCSLPGFARFSFLASTQELAFLQ